MDAWTTDLAVINDQRAQAANTDRAGDWGFWLEAVSYQPSLAMRRSMTIQPIDFQPPTGVIW